MLHRIATIATATYREAVRARILIGLAGVAFALAFYSLIVGAFTLREASRVVADLGAMTIGVFSLAVAILIGATSLHRELELKTILPLLARPIHRYEFLIGKYLGILLVVLVFIMAESGLVMMMGAMLAGRSIGLVVGTFTGLLVVVSLGAWRFKHARTFGPILWAAAMMFSGFLLASVARGDRSLVMASSTLTLLEVAIVAAIALVFSSFSTPFLSSLFTVGIFFVGRSADTMAQLPKRIFGETLVLCARALSGIIPNLHVYVPARPLLTGEAIDANLPRYLAMASVQSLAWVVGLMAFAAFIFRRRDFS
ncbi:MAG: hypothetical protein EXR75_16365 [Myxococcales bacterium]|nr:hypothetical protein [Myxococcales bacterium]